MDFPKNNRGSFSFAFLIAGGFFLIFILALAYFFYGLQPSFATENVTQFKILKGESFRDIGAHLSQRHLIRSISVFKIYSILSGRVHKFQPGLYELNSNLSVPEIELSFNLNYGREERG